VPVQVLKDFEAKYGIPLIEGYGLSEASRVAKNRFMVCAKPARLAGRSTVEVSVQMMRGKSPLGEIGEICVRAATNAGY